MDLEPTARIEPLSDQALLRQYVKQKSEAAFAQIVRRHYPLVYSACKRQVEDAELAEDVAQVVFMLLARKAPTLRGGTGLAGWLFQTACFASKNAVRQERRRQRRERQGQEVVHREQTIDNPEPEAIWGAVEPRLNDALNHLKPEDREAVLLRFFESCSLAEVGLRLEVSENTARMRITRALGKMRLHLSREGIVISAVVFSAILTKKAHVASSVSDPIHSTFNDPLHPLGPATGQAHQLMQGVLTTMSIKTATTVAVVATACLTAIAVPLMALTSPRIALTNHTTHLAQAVSDPNQRIARIIIVHHGAIPVADSSILAVLSQKVGNTYDATQAQQDVKAIKSLGVFRGTVIENAAADPHGGLDVTYTVAENPFIKTITFTANTPDGLPSVPVSALKSHMETKEGQVLNTASLMRDMSTLLNTQNGYMRSQGFAADEGVTRIDPVTGTLTIGLIETHIAQLEIQGNSQVPTLKIMEQVHSKAGDVLNYHTLDEDLVRVTKMGLFTKVGPPAETTDANHEVTVVISVVEK